MNSWFRVFLMSWTGYLHIGSWVSVMLCFKIIYLSDFTVQILDSKVGHFQITSFGTNSLMNHNLLNRGGNLRFFFQKYVTVNGLTWGQRWMLKYYLPVKKQKNSIHLYSKVIYTKYSKHWPYTMAHTIDCVCIKMLNHGLNHGLFISLFKLIPCPMHWIIYVLAYLNFIFEF